MKPVYHIKQMLCARAAQQRVPISGAFELTPRCNFRCKMCYIRQTPEQMAAVGRERTARQWLELGRQARDAGMIFLLLTGGEPFLRPDFGEIYEGLTKLGLSISINTNGSLLSDSLKELFRRLPPAMVNVTVYAASPQGYETLCGSGAGYEKALQAMDFFRQLGVVVNMNTTITPWNVADYEQIWAVARSRNLSLRVTGYNFPPARGGCSPEYSRLEPEEVGRLLARDVLYTGGEGQLRQIAAKLGTADEISMRCTMEPGEGMACYAGKSQFWVTWDGRMSPCGMLEEPVADPFEAGFAPAWQQIAERTAQITLCPDCRDCEIKGTCTNCAAVTHAETGRFDGKPDYMCRLNQSYRKEIRRMANEELCK